MCSYFTTGVVNLHLWLYFATVVAQQKISPMLPLKSRTLLANLPGSDSREISRFILKSFPQKRKRKMQLAIHFSSAIEK